MSGEEVPIPEFRGMAMALESLDGEDLQVWFSTRACAMKRAMPVPMKFSRVVGGSCSSCFLGCFSVVIHVAQRFTKFARGDWTDVDPCTGVWRSGSHSFQKETEEATAKRPPAILVMGMVVICSTILGRDELTPGTEETLRLLKDPVRRRPRPREVLPDHLTMVVCSS